MNGTLESVTEPVENTTEQSLYGCKIWGRFANGETPLKTENLKREKNICGAIFSEVIQEIRSHSFFVLFLPTRIGY